MATVSSFTEENTRKRPYFVTSGLAQVASSDSIELDLPNITNYPHCFVSVHLLDGAEAATTASAGVFTVTIRLATGQVFEAPCSENTIQATALTSVSFGANVEAVRVTQAGLSGPTQWRIKLSGNQQFEK